MVLRRHEGQVKKVLTETIVALCRNTLAHSAHVCVEGLLGVTLDDEEIFLVSIKETFQKEVYCNSSEAKGKLDGALDSKFEPDGSSRDSDQSRKRRRKRRKRLKNAISNSEGESEEDLSDGPDRERP